MENEFELFLEHVFGLEKCIGVIVTRDFILVFDQEGHVVDVGPADKTTTKIINNICIFIH